ncbi:TATA box-binding protein-like protein 1 isoform X1 [Diachasma alloeum]|uniref:TATA box-binding protein-like protein 1 isoform X1 n=1 Tax=Diachasma alloeum TaxID=454923 RepID=UPI00073814E3|nr:TATA box-binding protein-like protein 1 isoform X1 [Diachasma alloeum]
MMATAVQENGMRPLTNGSFNHVEKVEPVDNLENGETINETETPNNSPPSMPVEESDAPREIDIVIRNVVCSFSVRCHLNLREIALRGANVEYKREHGMITMKLRNPSTTASIWSSGKISCTGAESESDAKKAARKIARCLAKLGFNVRFSNFRVVNVLGTCLMPWDIRINLFSMAHREHADYEPELHPGVTYKLTEPKATLKIFSTGNVTITGTSSVALVANAVEKIFPLVQEFRKPRTQEELAARRRRGIKRARSTFIEDKDPIEESIATDIEEDEEMALESDGDWD